MFIKKLIWMVCLTVILSGAWDARAETGQNQTPAEPPPATASQNTTETDATVPSVTEEILPTLSRIGVSLLVIVVIIYATVFLLKKLSGNKIGGAGKNKTVTVIEQTYIAPKKSVCLLKIADRAVLVGITDTNINMLTECEWEDLPENQREQAEKSNQGFTQALTDAAGKLFKGSTQKEGSDEVS